MLISIKAGNSCNLKNEILCTTRNLLELEIL